MSRKRDACRRLDSDKLRDQQVRYFPASPLAGRCLRDGMILGFMAQSTREYETP